MRFFSTDARKEPRDTNVMRREAQRQQEQQTNKRFTETKEKFYLQRNAWCTMWLLVHLSSSILGASVHLWRRQTWTFLSTRKAHYPSLSAIKDPGPDRFCLLADDAGTDSLPSKKKTKKKNMKKTTTKKKIGVEASEQGISSAEGTHTTDRRFYFSCLPQERKIQQQANKQYQSSCSCSVLHKKGEDVQCLSAGLSKAQGSLQNTYCQKVSSADYLQSRQNRAAVRSFVVVCRLR